MTQPCARQLLALRKAAHRCCPTARTRGRGFRCMNRGNTKQAMRTAVGKESMHL